MSVSKHDSKNDDQISEMEKIRVSIITIGEWAVGKTSIARRFTNDTFLESYKATIGVDRILKDYIINEKKLIQLQIWDTAGQEKFSVLPTSYLKKANGIIFVYDITDNETFSKLIETISNTINLDKLNIPFVIVGNKKDKVESREVSLFEANKSAKDFDCEILEVSAKTGENVKKAFDNLLIKILDKKNQQFSNALREKNGIVTLQKNIDPILVNKPCCKKK